MNATLKVLATVLLAAPLLAFGCNAGSGSIFDDDDDTGSDGGSGGNAGEGFHPGGFGGGGGEVCDPTTVEDFDGDGFSEVDGDCNDCDSNVSPNAIEVATEEGGEPIDEDCDQDIDEDDVYIPCDADIAIDETDPLEAIKAMGLCKSSTGANDWGVVEAKWVLADGYDPPISYDLQFHLGHGVLPQFGANITVPHGERMLALSSGTARQPNDPGYEDVNGFDKSYTSGHPFGFPKESPACPGTTTGEPHDSTGIQVKMHTPSNAHGITFDFNFYTYEWPGYVCSTYNDFFVALLEPFPSSQLDGNISYDSLGNPVSVNNAFIDVCGCDDNPPSACTAGGKTFNCALGNSELIGTGFGFDTSGGEDHGATSWLTTTAPVDPSSEITLRFAVYDSGDGILDSTTLIDNFRWIAKPGVAVGTTPTPK